MSKLGLTKEERALVAQLAVTSESRFHRLWYYSAALAPALGFGVYGLVRADLVALIVALLAFAFFTYWHIASEIKATPLFFSLCKKIDAFERGSDA